MSDNCKVTKAVRIARERRTRMKIRRNSDRKRLIVFRSARHMYAQVIDDANGQTLASSSTLLKEFKNLKPVPKALEAARWVGADLAKKAVVKGIDMITFDRGPYLFHGRVKALAEAARENGLKF